MEKEYFEKFGHTCGLRNEEEEDYETNRIKGSFTKWKTVDPLSTLTLQHFNSHAAIVNEQRSHLLYFPLTLHPFSRIIMVWERIMLVVYAFALFWGQLKILFFVGKSQREIGTCIIVMFVVRIICFADMARRFFTGFIDKNTNHVS